MYSVNQAARIMGISERHLRLLLENGQVMGKKLGHDWVVLEIKYQRKRKPKGGDKMLKVTLRCLSCGYVKLGYHDSKKVSEPSDYNEPCPNCDDGITNMDVVKVVESGKVIWQDPMWVKEEAKLVREIDNLGRKIHTPKRRKT